MLIHVVDASGRSDRDGVDQLGAGEGAAEGLVNDDDDGTGDENGGGAGGVSSGVSGGGSGRGGGGDGAARSGGGHGGDPAGDVQWVRHEIHAWVGGRCRCTFTPASPLPALAKVSALETNITMSHYQTLL